MGRLAKVIAKQQSEMASDPDQAEESFDQSVSMKRYRMSSSDSLMSKRTLSRQISSGINIIRVSQDPNADKKIPTSPPSVPQ